MRALGWVVGVLALTLVAAAVVLPLALVYALVQDDDWIGEL